MTKKMMMKELNNRNKKLLRLSEIDDTLHEDYDGPIYEIQRLIRMFGGKKNEWNFNQKRRISSKNTKK